MACAIDAAEETADDDFAVRLQGYRIDRTVSSEESSESDAGRAVRVEPRDADALNSVDVRERAADEYLADS
jgi:hypothetical protein